MYVLLCCSALTIRRQDINDNTLIYYSSENVHTLRKRLAAWHAIQLMNNNNCSCTYLYSIWCDYCMPEV